MSNCKVVRGGEGFRGKQGLDYFAGLSAETVGAKGLCMHLVEMPPGARANAHFHENHETALYVLEGTVEMLYGPHLEHRLEVTAGDFLYIPAQMPHLPYNPTSGPAKAVLARTDPNEQESVVLTPHLDEALGKV